jgi:hypothetical protein
MDGEKKNWNLQARTSADTDNEREESLKDS